MPNSYFQFKQFTIHQENCAMKVSTDAVILGALVNEAFPTQILDIGTGTGVISLMLAQRFQEAKILGLEIDQPTFEQANENKNNSPFKDQIEIHHLSFQEFSKKNAKNFPLIVSNPPYFPNHNKSKNDQRNKALHNDELSFGDLIKGVVKLLDKNLGAFWVILPPRQMDDLERIAAFFGLYPKDFFELRDRPSTKVLRHVKSFTFTQSQKPIPSLITIKNNDSSYSKVYKDLLKDFLLIF
ncbi:methyltransferase [Echinicola sp. CAU 1574]|uniref:tRNA1(Val) (adenine(37)-N6)-methyltransferase n=1 Tax=Echinicola arenosa TaxID=2774144 RepID=A0ABR9AHU5_9BACT|nr:methyltransferase [Echinicola arenosa]MBD8488079.1 methyltransferase [Echinicola arenosa]